MDMRVNVHADKCVRGAWTSTRGSRGWTGERDEDGGVVVTWVRFCCVGQLSSTSYAPANAVRLHVNGFCYTGYAVGPGAFLDAHVCHECTKGNDASTALGIDEYGILTSAEVEKEGSIV